MVGRIIISEMLDPHLPHHHLPIKIQTRYLAALVMRLEMAIAPFAAAADGQAKLNTEYPEE